MASPAVFSQETVETQEPEPNEEADDPNRGRFLTLPFFVTEPAIGEGLGVAAVYFHRKPEGAKPKVSSGKNLARTGKRSKPPPTATGIFGMYTSNETSALGIGHSGSTPTDKYRYVGLVSGLQVNATYYENDFPTNFSLDGGLAYIHGKRRFGESNVFIGMSASYLDSTTHFKIGDDEESLTISDIVSTDVGVALSGIYDVRDDTMMPSSGQLVDFTVWHYDEALGGDFDYWKTRLKLNSFHQMSEKFVLGLRLEVGTAGGDVPFYAAPYVPLRGIPALRYQGETAGVFEIEGRYNIGQRWAAIAFAGSGFVDEDEEISQTEDDIWGAGVGFRFQALPEQNVWIGIDIARGPEDYAWYIQMGHPW